MFLSKQKHYTVCVFMCINTVNRFFFFFVHDGDNEDGDDHCLSFFFMSDFLCDNIFFFPTVKINNVSQLVTESPCADIKVM